MFIGRYYHTLETKWRLAIPQAFRSKLQSGGVITRGLDGCLFLFPDSYWQKLAKKLASLPLTSSPARTFTRLLVQEAVSLDLDSQGRTLIPTYLRDSINLKKQVVVAGALTRIEIWDREAYHQHLDLLAADTQKLEDEISDLGI